MKTIAIANQKGGVGKTTTAVSLAHGLANAGKSVVLIDLDPQGNCAPCLRVAPAPGLYRLLLGFAKLEDVLVEVRDNLWLLPSDPSTAELKAILSAKDYKEYILATALEPLDVDYCVLDCAPSRDVLHTSAHHAASQVIVPAGLDFLALAGVVQEFETIKMVRNRGHSVEVSAVLPTFWDRTTNESANNLKELVDRFGDLVMPAVSRCTRLREAPAVGQTIWEYLPEHHQVREAYSRLTRRVLDA